MFWFTSDTHFGHKNIIKHCNRPFATVEEMDTVLIDNINAVVKREDTLFHLGDFSFRGGDPAVYRNKLNVKNIVLLRGNHDPARAKLTFNAFAVLFSEVHELIELNKQKQLVVLCHYAMRTWRASHRGSWHLFGHSHGKLKVEPNVLAHDIGVDNNNFKPLNWYDVANIMKQKMLGGNTTS